MVAGCDAVGLRTVNHLEYLVVAVRMPREPHPRQSVTFSVPATIEKRHATIYGTCLFVVLVSSIDSEGLSLRMSRESSLRQSANANMAPNLFCE